MASKSKKSPETKRNCEKNTENVDEIYRIVYPNITILPGKRTDPQVILKGCIAAASCNASISGYTKVHTGLPSHTTSLKFLHRLNMEEMVQNASRMLVNAGKDVIRKGQKYAFAIDKTQDPYYGKHDDEPDTYTVGGKTKDSTNHFFTYLTMSIIDQGRHLTLFSIPWRKGMKNLEAIQQCIELIDQLGLKIRCLCLDREFYDGEIFQYLQETHIPHIVPAKKSGKPLKAMLKGRSSKTFNYTLNKGSKNPVDLVITDCVVYLKGKNEKHGIVHHAFVVFGISSSPRNIREIYRHRFAIESTYRLRNTTRPKTSTKDPKIRFFYALISFIIQNLWVSHKWKRCAKKQQGPKVIEEERLQLAHFAMIIQSESTNWFVLKGIDDIAIT